VSSIHIGCVISKPFDVFSSSANDFKKHDIGIEKVIWDRPNWNFIDIWSKFIKFVMNGLRIMAIAQHTHTGLNEIQVSLLRIFNRPMSEEQVKELKRLLVKYYSSQLKEEITKVVSEKGYTQKDFDDMLNSDS